MYGVLGTFLSRRTAIYPLSNLFFHSEMVPENWFPQSRNPSTGLQHLPGFGLRPCGCVNDQCVDANPGELEATAGGGLRPGTGSSDLEEMI